MAKFTLASDFTFDFKLLGISCHETEYRFCSNLNRYLGFNFIREKSIEINSKKLKETFSYSLFSSEDIDTSEKVFLISNNSKNIKKVNVNSNSGFQSGLFDNEPEFAPVKSFLIPEKHDVDFFLMFPVDFAENTILNIQERLSKMEGVLSCFEIDAAKLNSKINLLF